MTHDAPLATAPPVLISDNPLAGIDSQLLVQAECHRAPAATSLVHTHGVGIVYSVDPLRRNHAKTDSAGAVNYTRRHAPLAAVLVDASLYTGKNRKPATAAPTRDWIAFQRRHDLPWAMTDSGYCADADRAGLRNTLAAGAALGSGVIVALPVAGSWLTDDASTLKAAIEKYSVPVALMVEDEQDPFDQSGAVAGLVEVLGATSPVLLLRSDAAALGALAYGAAATAVGTTSTYRHIYPMRNGGGGANNLSFVIPSLLGYFLDRRFENAHRLASHLAAWRCDCTYCAGSDLSWIRTHPSCHDAAFQHSVATLADIGRGLAAAITDGASAPSAWTQTCQLAQMEHFDVGEATDGLWLPKDSLAEWIKATPSTVGI